MSDSGKQGPSCIRVIDSHTEGEPTRIVIAGGPDLGDGPLALRRERLRDEFDDIRRAVINEPRGSDVLVGGILCEPVDASCAAAVVFFNNAGVLQMCGHGTIGLVVTLHWLKKIEPGVHRIETPVGVVTATLHDAHRVSIQNVPSYRLLKGVRVPVDGFGAVTGDVAWGGNWFFLCQDHGQTLSADNWRHLTDFTLRIRQGLQREGITGADGAEIDHLELFGPPVRTDADSRSFVLCPGEAWDRSPCGTGTSAKLACLAADGKLPPGTVWRQESLIGSLFEGFFQPSPVPGHPDAVLPTITGKAWVMGDNMLHLDASDPFRFGIKT